MAETDYPRLCAEIAEALGLDFEILQAAWNDKEGPLRYVFPWHTSPEAAGELRQQMERAGWRWRMDWQPDDKKYAVGFSKSPLLGDLGWADTEAHAIVLAAHRALCGEDVSRDT